MKKLQSDKTLNESAIEQILDRGVTLEEIAELVFNLQEKYVADLTMEYCLENVKRVLKKREVCNAVITGIELDRLTEQGKVSHPLSSIIKEDEGLYGVDEILALSIVNVYGSIGLTNFGYLDKLKPKVIQRLDSHKHTDQTNTFLDDIVGALAAAAASRIAHADPDISKIMQ